VTVKVRPAIIRVAERGCEPGFAATEKLTVPEPLPLVPELIVIQLAPEAVSQTQSAAAAVRFTLPAPPVAPNDWLVDEMLKSQVAPACVTVKVLPAMVRVPGRDRLLLLAATEKVTEPLPLPADPEFNVMKPLLLVAFHAQPAGAVTLTVTLPPAAGDSFALCESW
jgi:hypothetical protein